MRQTTILKVIITLIAVALLSLLLPRVRQAVLGKKSTGSAPEAAESGDAKSSGEETNSGPALPVVGVVVHREPFVLTIRGTGRAEAVRRVQLAPRIGGRITAVHASEGETVKAGAAVLDIDREPLEIELREAESALATAEADLNVKLSIDGPASESKRALLAQRTGVTAAEEKIARVRLDLESLRITAPFTGVIAELAAEPGGMARASESLATLVDLATIRIRAEVLENDFGQLTIGSRARVRFPALTGETFEGRVDALGPEIDPSRGTGVIYVRLENPESRIRPGMYADLTIDGRSFDERTAVPRAALIERDRKLLVFRASAGRAEWQYVETGLETDRLIEITSGVADGDTILVEGHLTLAHAAPVRVTLSGE